MDGLTLLQEARAAGLDVQAKDGRLAIRGPRRAEPIARQLLDHKAELLALLSERTVAADAWDDTAVQALAATPPVATTGVPADAVYAFTDECGWRWFKVPGAIVREDAIGAPTWDDMVPVGDGQQ